MVIQCRRASAPALTIAICHAPDASRRYPVWIVRVIMDCGPQVVPTSALWGPARGPGQIGPAGAFNQRIDLQQASGAHNTALTNRIYSSPTCAMSGILPPSRPALASDILGYPPQFAGNVPRRSDPGLVTFRLAVHGKSAPPSMKPARGG